MEVKYKTCHRIQIISCISYVIFSIFLYCMIFAELSYTPIVIAGVLSTASLVVTTASGVIRAFIGHKIGLRATKKDWLIIAIVLTLVILYFIFKYI